MSVEKFALSFALLAKRDIPQAKKVAAAAAAQLVPGPIGLIFPLIVARGTSADDTTTLAKVPDVIGDTETEAKTAIKGAGLAIKETHAFATDTTKGTVLSQEPEPNKYVVVGSDIEIIVSAGPAPATNEPQQNEEQLEREILAKQEQVLAKLDQLTSPSKKETSKSGTTVGST